MVAIWADRIVCPTEGLVRMTIEVLWLPAGTAFWIAPDLEYAVISTRLGRASRRHVADCLEEFDRLRKGLGADRERPALAQEAGLVGCYPE